MILNRKTRSKRMRFTSLFLVRLGKDLSRRLGNFVINFLSQSFFVFFSQNLSDGKKWQIVVEEGSFPWTKWINLFFFFFLLFCNWMKKSAKMSMLDFIFRIQLIFFFKKLSSKLDAILDWSNKPFWIHTSFELEFLDFRIS